MVLNEWRRKIGGAAVCTPGQTFASDVGVQADDGYINDNPTFDATGVELIAGEWSAGSRQNNHAWMRYPNVTIPAGARIDAATMTVKVKWAGNDGSGVKTNIYANDEDDASAPTTKAEMEGKSLTADFTAWDDADLGPLNTEVASPDISAPIQEVIDRGGWASGQALMLLWRDDGSSSDKRYSIWSWDYDDNSHGVYLEVEYCA